MCSAKCAGRSSLVFAPTVGTRSCILAITDLRLANAQLTSDYVQVAALDDAQGMLAAGAPKGRLW